MSARSGNRAKSSHPFAWLLRRSHSLATEELGDRVAAGHLGRKTYRATLAALALERAGTRPLPGGALGLFRTPDIIARLRRLSRSLAHEPLGARRSFGTSTVGLLAAFALATVQLAPAHFLGDKPARDSDSALPFASTLTKTQQAMIADSTQRAFRSILSLQRANGCMTSNQGGDANNQVATTALTATAMLAHGGAAPDSRLHEPMKRALEHVLTCQAESGEFASEPGAKRSSMYHHFIATWCVAKMLEYVADGQRPEVKKRLERAVKIIVDAQAVPKVEAARGGWRYSPKSKDSDLSCTAWAVRALVAAQEAEIEVADEVFGGALRYVLSMQSENGGFDYAHAAGRSSIERTGMAAYCIGSIGNLGALPQMAKATLYIDKNFDSEVSLESPWHYYGMMWCAAGLREWPEDTTRRYAEWMYRRCMETQGQCRWPSTTPSQLLNNLFVLHAYAPSL